MAEVKLILPSMGEGIQEATITEWMKDINDSIQEDEIVIQIETDKVNSDIPSTVSGKLIQRLKEVNEVCQIGEAFAIIETEDSEISNSSIIKEEPITHNIEEPTLSIIEELQGPIATFENTINTQKIATTEESGMLSPLVRSIIQAENITSEELKQVSKSGKGGRITKDDLLSFLTNRNNNSNISDSSSITTTPSMPIETNNIIPQHNSSDEIIKMDRMRTLIAKHMLDSKRISPHVTSFVEADVTNVVNWRNKVKDEFQAEHNTKLTYMPVFIYAIAQALKEFPMINISVEEDTIIKKVNINIGIATALPSGNLIVPVIKNADTLSIPELAKAINDLATRARNNELKPEEVKGGTYTVSNIGGFGNIMGTPIINQPQVAIMAIGAIEKKPAVIETPTGDAIGIRHKMYLSHTYDHRVVDGALGGLFAKKVADILADFK